MASRADRVAGWWHELTPASLGILVVGTAALFVGVAGTVVHVWIEGITPVEELTQTLVSGRQASIWYLSIALGAVGIVWGYGTYKRMPTKAAKEASVSGAALALQAIVFSGLLLVLSGGNKFPLFIRQFFNFDVLDPFYGQVVRGAVNTIYLAFFGQALGMGLGLFLAMLILSNRVVVRIPARLYINVVRGTPLIVQLSIGFFGIVIGLGLRTSTFTVAGIILGLSAGAYTAEIFRAGIQSLERGQMEASRSLGMTYLQAMGYVIVPQAVRRVIPPLMNEFIILIKDTSLVFILGLTFAQRELLSVGRDAYAETFNATPYVAAAIGYLIVTLPLIRGVTALERRLRSGLVGIGA